MARSLAEAAQLADNRMSAALHRPEGAPIVERRRMEELLPAFSGLPISGREAFEYAAWVAPHSAGVIAFGADVEEVMLALVSRTILTTQLALADPGLDVRELLAPDGPNSPAESLRRTARGAVEDWLEARDAARPRG